MVYVAAIEDALRAFGERRQEVVAVLLFVSAAVGRLRADSDVDVALLLDGSVPQAGYLMYRLRASAELEPALGRRADVVIVNDAPVLLRFEALRAGQIGRAHV